MPEQYLKLEHNQFPVYFCYIIHSYSVTWAIVSVDK
jgi:hypothetical protein